MNAKLLCVYFCGCRWRYDNHFVIAGLGWCLRWCEGESRGDIEASRDWALEVLWLHIDSVLRGPIRPFDLYLEAQGEGLWYQGGDAAPTTWWHLLLDWDPGLRDSGADAPVFGRSGYLGSTSELTLWGKHEMPLVMGPCRLQGSKMLLPGSFPCCWFRS